MESSIEPQLANLMPVLMSAYLQSLSKQTAQVSCKNTNTVFALTPFPYTGNLIVYILKCKSIGFAQQNPSDSYAFKQYEVTRWNPFSNDIAKKDTTESISR